MLCISFIISPTKLLTRRWSYKKQEPITIREQLSASPVYLWFIRYSVCFGSNFFINVANDIGNDNNVSTEEHPSIKIIKQNKKEIPKLIFHEIENDFVSKQINKTNSKKTTGHDFVSKQINKANSKKATGHDGISAKLLKFAKPAIVKPITNSINKSINNSIFPEN